MIAAGMSADPLGWKALRASMGSAFRLPVGRDADASAAIEGARNAGLRVVALAARGGADPADVDLTGPVCLVVGGEGAGLSPAVLSHADATLSLPMQGPVESLNVAVAAALALYAAAAQRRPRP
jgi:TrmH family RNA methyltransferase